MSEKAQYWRMLRVLLLCFFSSLLTRGASAQPCELLADSPEASVRNCAGVHVVKLSGKPVDRARAMGKLLAKKNLSPDVIIYFSNKVTNAIEREAGWLARPFTLIYNQVVRLSHYSTPAFLAEEVDAMAEGMGIDPIVLRRGLSLADTGSLLQGLGSRPMLGFLPAAGCTSIAAKGPAGGFVYGRNLDFVGVDVWDKHPMLLAVEPPEGSSELRHLVIGADGLLFGGITGVNEAGLTFAVHQNYTRDAGFTGVPMLFIGELVLRHARNLAEAEQILRKFRPATLWTFVVTDLKSGETLAAESSQENFLLRRGEGPHFTQTNHAMHSDSRSTENASIGVRSNSIFRMKLAFEALESRRSTDIAILAKILAYQEDPEGRLSAYHDVLKAHTIQTVLFEAFPGQDARLFLSMDEAPTSGGRFAVFPLDAFWKRNLPDPGVEIMDLVRTPPEKRKNQRKIAEAFRIYFDEGRALEASRLLEGQRTFNAGLFRAVALLEADRGAEALSEAENTLRDPHFVTEPAYIRTSLELVQLTALLRLKRMDEARNLARSMLDKNVMARSHLRVLELCQKVVDGQSIPAGKLRLSFDFFSGDLSGRKN